MDIQAEPVVTGHLVSVKHGNLRTIGAIVTTNGEKVPRV
jgi:hypothetical protein